MTMKWKDGPPTEPGYYWWTWMHAPGLLRFANVIDLDGVMCVDQGEGFCPASKPLRYWAGPLSIPEGSPKPRTKPWPSL